MTGGVTIGQAAAFAGVTVKTVRHYHRLGLVDEPPRDSSGYRRYGSTELLRLVQARTLAGAGVPLAEVGELLDADPERFAASLADVDRRLAARIVELTARRETLHRLADGDRALLPDRACAVLDRMVGAGFADDFVAIQREAFVLTSALAPELFDSHVATLGRHLADPAFVDLLKRCWDAEAWDPDDPRVDELADAMAEHLLANRDGLVMPASFRARPDADTRYGLVNYHREQEVTTSARLTELIDRRLREAGVEVPRS